MNPARFLWSPGDAAAQGGRPYSGAMACALASFAQGVTIKWILERPELTHKDSPPLDATWYAFGASAACIALVAWFIRATSIELALDFRRKQRNMRPTLFASGWITAIAATMGALWGAVAIVAVPKGASPVIRYAEGSPVTEAHVSPQLWVLTVPFLLFWAWRAVWEGRAAAKLYGRPVPLAVAVSFAAGLVALLLAFIAVPTITAQYDRISHAFRG